MDLCLHIGCFCLAWQQALGLEKHWLAVSTGIAGVVYRHLKMFARRKLEHSDGVRAPAACVSRDLHAGVQERERREHCGKM